MIQEYLVRILLLPFSGIYALLMLIRNGLYESGLLRSVRFNLPVIGVGNLSLGGAGKTPHVEYLIRLLQPFLTVGTLSRGYKRKSKGFKIVTNVDNAESVGDEPLQYFKKFPDVKVAVSESRSLGIPLLLSKFPDISVILLDDSYQHRSVTPGLNILLTEYSRLYVDDIILPAGRLREWKSGADRADIIVVTKCPPNLNIADRDKTLEKLSVHLGQRVFFSEYHYENPYHLISGIPARLSDFDNLLLLCAIANEDYLMDYLTRQGKQIYTMIYEDHHFFSPHELSILKRQLDHIGRDSAVVITTEKDATRLLLHREYLLSQNIPVFVLPIKVHFLFQQQKEFDDLIKGFLLNFKV